MFYAVAPLLYQNSLHTVMDMSLRTVIESTFCRILLSNMLFLNLLSEICLKRHKL